MYKYLFGPVPSRRLGISLGVDLVPKKVCSLDCVYCEVGNTTKHTTERMEYIPYDKVTAELTDYFLNNPDPDYITFSGSGEPTLNSRIGDVIRFVKNLKPEIPVAVLTNGTMLYDKKVQEELMEADLLMPSLDAATRSVFERLNRPATELDFNRYIQGLIEFCEKFKGKIWLEVFILPGYNDNAQELEELKRIIEIIAPDSVQINTLDRPGVVENIRAATHDELERVVNSWGLSNVEIIAAAKERKKIQSYRKDAESAILETIARRPCTIDDLEKILGIPVVEINKYLDVLEAEKKVVSVRQERGLFYQLKNN
jgi:wyosine [tRNA(Phe)-imidazoG37] synthetase (radical SAM superfamily)